MKPDIEAIKSRCKRAIKGSWELELRDYAGEYEEYHILKPIKEYNDDDKEDSLAFATLHKKDVNTALFIAYSRQDIPALIFYIADLETKLSQSQASYKTMYAAKEQACGRAARMEAVVEATRHIDAHSMTFALKQALEQLDGGGE